MISLARRMLIAGVILVGFVIAWAVIATPLDADAQTVIALGGIVAFLVLDRFRGRRVTIILAVLSCLVSLRYLHWRIADTLEPETFWQGVFMIGLVLAEAYAVLALILGYFQTLWPLERRPAPLPADPETWPTVDIYIPTYNEDLEVVRPTVLAALAMDWPADKFRVWILDDGRRQAFRDFAESCGAGYMVRPDNKGAKAGNLNHALEHTDGEYVAIFDCDHVPTRAFLQMTLGWMVRDKKLGMLQTPHHFYSLDPFERNLSEGRDVPNEGLMFYGLVQPGNDLWNATFFCGSCAVLRRTAILEIGGIPHETVTEDCHASLKMQRLGWNTAFIRVPLAAGLATERLIIHIGQRMRWARGMLQIMRVDNPLFGPGLSLPQRICYFSAMFHFLFAAPRVVFLTAPLAFLLLGHSVIAASPLAIIAYAGPHIFHAVATGSRVAGGVRHSFWSEIYETVLALWLLPVTLATILDPKKGKFNVTEKGGLLPEGYFDWRAVWPSVILTLLLIAGVVAGAHGVITNPWGSLESQAFLLNGIWATLCLVPVLASVAAGRERKQLRTSARVSVAMPAMLVMPDGERIDARTRNLSLGGAGLVVAKSPRTDKDRAVTLEIPMGADLLRIPAHLVRIDKTEAQLAFRPTTVQDESTIVRAVFGRADAWLSWDQHRPDRPLRSLLEVVATVSAVYSGRSQLSFAWWRARRERRDAVRRPVAPVVAVERRTEILAPRAGGGAAMVLALLLLATPAFAQRTPRAPAPAPEPPAAAPAPAMPPVAAPAPVAEPPPGLSGPPLLSLDPFVPSANAPGSIVPPPAAAPTRRVTRTLRQLGLNGPMQLRGVSPLQGVQFGVRADEVVTDARLIISGASSPALVPDLSQLTITMNDQLVGVIQPNPARPAFGPQEFPISSAFFTEMNRLNFAFTGRYAAECVDPLSDLLWLTVADSTSLQMTLERLPLPPDLARLPEPFFDPRQLRQPLVLPFVMPDVPNNEILRGAAITASWFAVQAEYRGARFPVSATLPETGSAIVLATPQDTPAGIELPALNGPTITLVPNRRDPGAMFLVLAGRNPAEVATAAAALAVAPQLLSGTTATVSAPRLPQRRPYEAPRWMPPDRPVQFGELVERTQLQVAGYAPGAVTIPLRTAPDLTTWRGHGFPVDIGFRAPPGPILDTEVSRLDISVSGSFLRAVPLREQESWPWSWMLRQVGLNQFPRRTSANVPTWLVTGSNQLELRFDMRPLHRGDCVAVPADVQASIDPTSTVDVSRAYRFATLPNLAFFASAGFPYTRLADLSETAVVMPDRPNPVEISTFLGLVGGLSNMVGVPATGLMVVRPNQLQQATERDLIVVGTLGRQPALGTLLRQTPLSIDESGRISMALPDVIEGFARFLWDGPPPEDRVRASAALTSPVEGLGFVAGAESPLSPGRSVVAIAAPTPGALESMAEALRDPTRVPRFRGDLVVMSGEGLQAFRTASSYTVGTLPFWLWPNHYLGNQPWALLLMLLAASLLIGLPLRGMLRRRAVNRLRGARVMNGLRAALLGAVAAVTLAGPALAQSNGAVAVLLRQARYWQEQNRPDLALQSFDRVLAADPRNADALAGAAASQAAMGNRQAAEQLLSRLREVAPGSVAATGAQDALRSATIDRSAIEDARRLSREGRVPEALTRYRDAFGGGAPPAAYAVEYWLTLGGTQAGWEESRQQLAALVAQRPDDGRARVALGQLLTWREQTRAQGITMLAELARSPTTAPAAIQAWRQALLWLGTGPQAEAPLQAFLAVRPGDAAIERRLAEVRDPTRRAQQVGSGERQEGFEQLEGNRLIDAARSFEAALAQNANDADALGGLGIVRLRQGRTEEARRLLERAIAADPARANNWRAALDGASYSAELAQGQAELRRGNLDAAEATLRRAVARDAADRTDAETALGEVLLRRNDYTGAEERFRAALARRPGFQPAVVGLERSLRQQGRIAEANELQRQIRVASPGGGGGTGGAGSRLRAEAARAPDVATAISLLRAAQGQAPNDPWIRLDLARALVRQGDGIEARAIMEAPLTESNPGRDNIFAAALFAEEQGRLGDASALIGRIPAGSRSPDMARLAQRTRVAAEVDQAAAVGGFEGRQRLMALAARQDPSGSTPAAVIRAFGRMNEPRGAEEAARVALAVNRNPTASARLAIAGALLEAGQEAQATALAQGLQNDPSLSADARRQAQSLAAGAAIRAADRANEAGDQAAGFDRLRPVLTQNPSDPAANLALARLYAGARRPADAQRIADSVLARDPRNLDARAGAVDAAIAARDYSQAQSLIDEGRALAPNEARISLMQARLLRARGNPRGALAAARLAEQQRQAQVGEVVPVAFAPLAAGPGPNPFRTAGVQVGTPLAQDPLSVEIGQEIAAAREAASTRFGMAPTIRGRSGTAGLDRLNELSVPMEASVAAPGIGGRLTGTVTPVTITAGSLPQDLNSLVSFGANPIAYPGGMLPPRDDTASGVAFNLGYRRDWFAADIGSTPIGFRYNNIVGGIEVAPGLGGGWRVRLSGERRAVTDSLLSWSGQRDALTGQTWGGVVRTGGRGQIEYASGPASFYAGGGYAVFEGSGVKDNNRIEAGAGMSYAVVRDQDQTVNLGADLVYFAYSDNLRFFTLGQGGYFSPQSYVALNLPVDWRARSGDWTWRLGGSLGYAVWSEDSSPVFPNDPGLQAQLVAQAANTTGLQTQYASQSESGVIGSFRGDVEYALTRDLAVGAMLRYDRSANWNEARGGVYVRYRLPD